MTVNVRDAGPFEKLVRFSVSDAEIDAAKTLAARRLSQELKIRGFRPGKAPRPIVERTVGSDRLRSEAIDDLLPEKLGEVLTEAELAPAVTPQLEAMDEKGDGLEVEVRITLWPTLEQVPEHLGRRIEVGSPEVTPDELAEQLERIREQFADLETVDRAAEEGDYVSIDIGAKAGEDLVPEASASQLLYEVGSGGFIEGIDEVLRGTSAGESRTFQGTLPEGFGDKAGLEVEFRVDVMEVKRKVLPDLTDEWVDEVTEFDTVEELRESLAEQMATMKKRSLAGRFRELALSQLVDQVEVELPDALVQAEMEEILHRFTHRLEEQQISLDDYFQVTGIPREQFVDDLREQAQRGLKTRLLLEAVADQDGIEVTREELSAVVEVLARQSDQPDAVRQAFSQGPRGQSLAADILRNKALDAIVAGATPVDEDGNEVDLTIDEAEFAQAEFEAEVVEGEVVAGDAEVPAAGVVEAEVVESSAGTGASEEE